LRAPRRGEAPADPHTLHYPAATATLMLSLASGALAGTHQETDPQIPLRSA
jgi:hypothetical protein